MLSTELKTLSFLLACKNVDPRPQGFTVMCLTTYLTGQICLLVCIWRLNLYVFKRPKSSSFRSNIAGIQQLICFVANGRNRNVKHTSGMWKPHQHSQAAGQTSTPSWQPSRPHMETVNLYWSWSCMPGSMFPLIDFVFFSISNIFCERVLRAVLWQCQKVRKLQVETKDKSLELFWGERKYTDTTYNYNYSTIITVYYSFQHFEYFLTLQIWLIILTCSS